jgi:hypothetical protein
MIVRELPDGTALLIGQESHADVAAQLAAHWGNAAFSRLDPYQSVVFGTAYHDSGHREMEADLPIDVETGLPYFHRKAPLAVRRRDADSNNFQWIRGRDIYAAFLASVHHAGLRKRRYDTVHWGGGIRDGYEGGAPAQEPALGMDAAFADLSDWQREVAEQLEITDQRAREAFWHNYRCLQTFDQLSLYFCCDGYDGTELKEATLVDVPVATGSSRTVDLTITPTGPDSVRISPYPFDSDLLQIAVMTRQMMPCVDQPDVVAKEGFYRATRCPLAWEISA